MFEALPGMADFGGGSEGGGGGSRRTSKVQNRKGWDDDSEEDEAELDAYVHLAIDHGTCCTARCTAHCTARHCLHGTLYILFPPCLASSLLLSSVLTYFRTLHPPHLTPKRNQINSQRQERAQQLANGRSSRDWLAGAGRDARGGDNNPSPHYPSRFVFRQL